MAKVVQPEPMVTFQPLQETLKSEKTKHLFQSMYPVTETMPRDNLARMVVQAVVALFTNALNIHRTRPSAMQAPAGRADEAAVAAKLEVLAEAPSALRCAQHLPHIIQRAS